MKIYIDVEESGRIIGYGSTSFSDSCIEIEVDEDHPVIEAYGQYKYIDGKLFKMPQEEIDAIYNKPNPPSDQERIEELENIILQLLMRG